MTRSSRKEFAAASAGRKQSTDKQVDRRYREARHGEVHEVRTRLLSPPPGRLEIGATGPIQAQVLKRCRTVEQVALVNTLCWVVEESGVRQ